MKNSPLFSGLTYAGGFMLIGTLIASLILLATDIPEDSWAGTTLFIHGLAMLVGGIVSGKRSGSKGWYQGILLGSIYTAVVWIIGFLAYDSGLTKDMLILAGLALTAGAIGGIIGVNLKK
ncbi:MULTISPECIES: TIGR04086 family membrane protein [unclassified Paenibacillus]|uniref:TIGR04086 family membrane protein n=1 Tax=unclassified Paenibacillus TaxID=185978 RepID=UPI001AE7244D|nr:MULTISPECIES: TIGR04086 family membrane protein [unclassified Paenibacillus]MBP1156552.1 putative membrane protein (TIGR04086 family) [Paenibacillus sp. PvP091]MBP1172710.1 putative membrane protein (TIGR04086 family) [Paenibacillus sp. PvR098]MBP2439090.1 putative membrane protein (TIGR04086 family) [Paenibacillus sp. PvP052]